MPKDDDFLLYPLDTGENPSCLACGKTMLERVSQISF